MTENQTALPTVDLEFTPNPNTLKYTTDRVFVEKGVFNYPERTMATGKSPLAEELFALPGVGAVMIAKSFLTVTLSDPESLTDLNEQIVTTIQNFLVKGNVAVFVEKHQTERASRVGVNSAEETIIQILEDEIRPAVAMDGGDITFEKFEDGIVYLHMKGSCAGCPSSTATLKIGIENRLKEAVPEVLEVVSI